MARNENARASISSAKGRAMWLRMSSMAILLLLLALTLEATQPNYRLCFPQVVGLPVLNPPQVDPCTGLAIVPNQAPTIDGCVNGDPGWTGAFRYVFGNGTNGPGCTAGMPCSPNVAVQGIRDNTFLYLSFEVNHDQTYDAHDLIVLTFSPTGNPTDDRRIHIYPNKNCVSPYTDPACGSLPKPVGSAPEKVEYWINSNNWDTPTVAGCSLCSPPPGVTDCVPPNGTLPATFDVKVSNSGLVNSGNVSWFVELKIPLTDFMIPLTGNFGLYFDVIRVNGNTGQATEFPWPGTKANNQSNGIGCAVDTSTPPPSDWGNGTLDPTATCNGVSLNWNDITSNHSQEQIDATCMPGPPPNCNNNNIFTATPHNNSVDATGNPIAANQITAKFSIANFGLPSNWTPVPVVNNPAGPTNLPASCGTVTNPPCPSLSTSPAWTITDPALISNYKAHPDQCILVDVDSLAFGVTLVNKSVKRNMWILTTSQVSKTAEISAKGYEPHPAHKTQQEFILHVLSQREVLNPYQQPLSRTATGQGVAATTRGGKEGRVVSRLTWTVDGCRLTGQYIIIKGEKYEICDDVGAFGAVVEHFGASAVARWQTSLEGPGLTRLKNAKDTYRLPVAQDTITPVAVRFAPQENRMAVFVDAGAGIPQGSFGSAFNNGFSLNAGLEYIATSHFSAEGIFGYHHFPGAITGDLNTYQFSVNGKTYLTTGATRPFFKGGVGGYKFSPGSTKFGGNIGAGILHDLTTRFGLQASYNFHVVNTPGAATKFSTLQVGIRVLF